MYLLQLTAFVLLIHNIFCQNSPEPFFQPLNGSHMLMLFNNTLVENLNHISKVTLKMTSYNFVENRNLAVAAKNYTEIQDNAEMTLLQPLDLEGGLLVKMDSCTPHKNLYLVVDCIIGAPPRSHFFNYTPLNFIEDSLDTWICKQDDTTIWMDNLRSSNFHAKKCIQHVNLYQNGELNKIVNGWNIVKPIPDEVNLTITLPDCTETLEVKLGQCSVTMERLEYEINLNQLETKSSDAIRTNSSDDVTIRTNSSDDVAIRTNSSYDDAIRANSSDDDGIRTNSNDDAAIRTNSSDAIRNVTELLEDLSSAEDELTEEQSVKLQHVNVYVWIGVSAGAVVCICIVTIIIIITIKVRRGRLEKKQGNIDTNPEYGDDTYEYYRQTEICDSNDDYY